MDANLLAELVALTAGHGSKKHRRVGFESDKIVVTILGADGDNSFGPPMAQRSGTKLSKNSGEQRLANVVCLSHDCFCLRVHRNVHLANECC